MDNLTKNKNQITSLTEGKILKPLLLFVLPIFGSMLLQSLYGAVDLYVVGTYGQTADVSAVTTGTQIMNLLTHTIMGLSMGTTVLVGQHIGAGKKDDAGRVIGAGILLFSALAILLTILVPCFAPQLCTLMKAPQEAFGKTTDYVFVCGLGLFFVVAYNLLGSIFRGIGDSKTPLLAVAIACVLNIIGDVYFVKVLGLAAKGAALATTLSQAISVIICFFVIKKRGLPFAFGKESFKKPFINIKRTVKVGFPIALQEVMVSLSFAIILTIVNDIGVVESAGIGVAEKVSMFVMLIPISFSSSLSAFVAQNIGAGKPERANKGLKYCVLISLGLAVFIAYFAFFHGTVLTGIFSKDPAVIVAGWDYLKGYAIDVLLTSFMFCFVGYFNGIKKTTFVMLQGVLSAFCIRVPISILMSKVVPVSLFKIALATPCATFCQVIACLIYFRICTKKQQTIDL